ncbi:hypothetical protein GCM10025771_41070 [Niveibacterium umoris]
MYTEAMKNGTMRASDAAGTIQYKSPSYGINHGACQVTARSFCKGVVNPYDRPPPVRSCNNTNTTHVIGIPKSVDAILANAEAFNTDKTLDLNVRASTIASIAITGNSASTMPGRVRNSKGTPASARAARANSKADAAAAM